DGPGAATGNGLSLAAAGQPPAKAKAEPPAKHAAALEPLQGKWRIITITEGKTTTPAWKWDEPGFVEIDGNTLSMPYLEAGGGRKREQFKIAVDDEKMPKTIDLIASGKRVGRGLYEFTAAATCCGSSHQLDVR